MRILAQKKATRRVRGEGYFVGDSHNCCYKIPIGKYENGRTKYKSFSGKSKREAKDRAEKYIQKYGGLDKLGSSPFLDVYITWWLKNYKRDNSAVKPQTYTRMCTVVNNQIIPRLGGFRIVDLTPDIIQTQLVNPLLNEKNATTGKPLSVSTIKKAIIHLKDCLNYAVEERLIGYNPCQKIKLSRNVISKGKKEIRFFSDEEIKSFVEATNTMTINGFPVYKHGYGLVFLLYTGLRIGELLALTANDIDCENKEVHVRGNCVEYFDNDEDSATYRHNVIYKADTTKTDNGFRSVPLCNEAFHAATQMLEKCKSATDYLLTHSETPAMYRNVARTYKSVCEKAGIENPGGLHTLRHTCASLLLRNGVDIKAISELLGHASVQFTYDTYIHLVQRQKNEAILTLNTRSAFSVNSNRHTQEKAKELLSKAIKAGLNENEIKYLISMIPPDKLEMFYSEFSA